MKPVANDTVIVKFKSTNKIKPNVADQLNSITGTSAFQKVEPLFPDEKDDNLASIYVAKLSVDSEISKIIEKLNKKKEIDYAHLSEERKAF